MLDAHASAASVAAVVRIYSSACRLITPTSMYVCVLSVSVCTGCPVTNASPDTLHTSLQPPGPPLQAPLLPAVQAPAMPVPVTEQNEQQHELPRRRGGRPLGSTSKPIIDRAAIIITPRPRTTRVPLDKRQGVSSGAEEVSDVSSHGSDSDDSLWRLTTKAALLAHKPRKEHKQRKHKLQSYRRMVAAVCKWNGLTKDTTSVKPLKHSFHKMFKRPRKSNKPRGRFTSGPVGWAVRCG